LDGGVETKHDDDVKKRDRWVKRIESAAAALEETQRHGGDTLFIIMCNFLCKNN
jgi:hypothetical protein